MPTLDYDRDYLQPFCMVDGQSPTGLRSELRKVAMVSTIWFVSGYRWERR